MAAMKTITHLPNAMWCIRNQVLQTAKRSPQSFTQFLRLQSSSPREDLQKSDSDSKTVISPTKIHDFFDVGKLFTVKDLFDARVHLGHVDRSLEPNMKDFVYGSRFGTTIIDLDQTAILLRQALNFIAHIASRGGIFLFVGRQPQLIHLIEKAAIEAGEFSHCRVWESNVFCAPRQTFSKEVRLPDCVIVVHTKDGIQYHEHTVIKDAAKVGIPTVGIVDTDCNPNLITYPIPGNDDTLDSVQLLLHLFKEAILKGKKQKTDLE